MWDREKAIQELVDNDIDTIVKSYNEMNDCSTMAFILESGFKGYRNLNDGQLMQELMERDISILFGEIDG